MPEIIDLDKIAAARRETKGELPIVKFGGEDFTLPPEMPFAVIEAVGKIRADENGEVDNSVVAESMGDIARALFGKKYRRFLDLGPSAEDISALLQNLPPLYGMNLEEEAAEEPTLPR